MSKESIPSNFDVCLAPAMDKYIKSEPIFDRHFVQAELAEGRRSERKNSDPWPGTPLPTLVKTAVLRVPKQLTEAPKNRVQYVKLYWW